MTKIEISQVDKPANKVQTMQYVEILGVNIIILLVIKSSHSYSVTGWSKMTVMFSSF